MGTPEPAIPIDVEKIKEERDTKFVVSHWKI